MCERSRIKDEPQRRSRSPSMGVLSLQSSQTQRLNTDRRETIGILRIDIGKPRRCSGSSVEFKDLQVEPPSPQPSVDRLSVSFAPGTDEMRSLCSENSGSNARENNIEAVENVRFPRGHLPTTTDGEDEDDYSASVNAIMQRRSSTKRYSKKCSRRTSSPFFPEGEMVNNTTTRRRSSVFTTSSGETAISMEENGATQEQIFERLRLHKEVLSSASQQPWPMRRKMKLVRQAKGYVQRHEGALQERLAHSRSTKDMAARANLLLLKFWQHLRRELANFMNLLVPWEHRIKEIESHFGSAVASYFTFLRWLFWVNLVIVVILAAFVAVPEVLASHADDAKNERKLMLPEERANATNLATLWDFEGILRYSPMFYGFYSNRAHQPSGYRLPFAYFMTSLAVYVYSFVATLRRMAKNSRMSKLSEKADDCIFTWKLLTGWDYMIGNKETAHNRTASIILGFKEALLEEREKIKDVRNWKLIGLRLLVNVFVLLLLGGSAYAVVVMVKRSEEADVLNSWWRQNEVSVVMSLITYLFPSLFELLGLLERYHPRKQLRLQLARIMVLNLLNLYSLIIALFGKIDKMTKELEALKPNLTNVNILAQQETSPVTEALTMSSAVVNLTTIMALMSTKICKQVLVPCLSTTARIETNFTYITSINDVTFSTLPPILSSSTNPHPPKSSTLMDVTIASKTTTESSDIFSTEYQLSTNIYLSNTTENYTWYNNENSTDLNYSTEDDILVSTQTDQSITEDRRNFSLAMLMFTHMMSNYFKVLPALARSLVTPLPTIDFSSTEQDTTKESLAFSKDFISNVTESTEQITGLSTEIKTESTLGSSSTETVENLETRSSQSAEQEMCYVTECMNLGSTEDQQMTSTVPTIYTTEQPGKLELCEVEVKSSNHILTPVSDKSNFESRRNLRRLCWETMFGQELVKLTVMDLVMTVATVLIIDFFRALFVRVMNHCWCWDLEKQFPQYGDFKIAENILQLVHNQGMVWMGMFFSPGLPLLNLVKLVLILYLRSWAVLTCNVPHEVLFRASRSNNFYLALLLTMLFLCVLPVGFAIVWLRPSWNCGPFSQYRHIFHILTDSVIAVTPAKLHPLLYYIVSPGIVIPLLLLLVLIIYYLMSLTGALREANVDLKIQLRRERTEERRKMFQMVDRRAIDGTTGVNGRDTMMSRWRQILPVIPKAKPADDNIESIITKMEPKGFSTPVVNMNNGNVKLSSTLVKQKEDIVGHRRTKRYETSDEESAAADGTDGEQQDSLPEDPRLRESKPSTHHQTTVKTASTMVSSARANIPVITISKTESTDQLLDGTLYSRSSPSPTPEVVSVQKAEPQQPSTPTQGSQ